MASFTHRYCEDRGETLCPLDRAGMVDVTQGVAAESSFTLAKGNVKNNESQEAGSINAGKPVDLLSSG